MPRYIIERSVPALSREELDAAARRSIAVIEGMPGVRWIRSYISAAEGKIYIASEEGKIAVLNAGAQWDVLQINDLEEGCYATPALAGGSIYLRTNDAFS